MAKTTGVVLYFNPAHNHGKAITDDNKEVYIHVDEITDTAKILIKGDKIEFDIEQTTNSDGIHYRGKNVTRVNRRNTGIVLEYVDGSGIVRCNENNQDYSIYYKDFINTTGEAVYKKNDTIVKAVEGDYIEFTISQKKENVATQIYYDARKPFYKFANIPNLERKYADLALMTPEPWNYLNSDPDNKFLPVLQNYITYTFARLRKEEIKYGITRIAIATTTFNWQGKDGKFSKKNVKCACFNTGLANKRQEPIYAYFVENLRRASCLEPEWVLHKFCKISDQEMGAFREKPESPDYFREVRDITEVIYNPSLEHELKYEHILEDRNARFKGLASLSDYLLQGILDQGLKRARERVRRNYKAAVPQYYNGKLQLLLPLSLNEPEITDLALVVEKVGERYFSSTILELEWAYSNARLIAKPDREWLDPVKEIDNEELEGVEAKETE